MYCAMSAGSVCAAGLLLRLKIWEQLDTADLYSDRRFFVVHDEDEAETPPPPPAGNTAQTSPL